MRSLLPGTILSSATLLLSLSQSPSRELLPADLPPDARVYTKLTKTSPGRLVVWRDADGTRHASYRHDNPGGCRTDIRSTIVLDAAGLPSRVSHEGQLCAPSRDASELFARTAVAATWRNAIEAGQSDRVGGSFYMSLADLPEERAILVRALLAAGRPLPLLPHGEARLERTQQLTIRAGARVETVTHYRLFGLDVGPNPVWLDSNGELFALNPDLIRYGWEASAAELQQAQSRASQPRQANLERTIVRRPDGSLVIHSARVFDSRTGLTHPDRTIVIAGSRIESVAPTVEADKRRPGAIDASGMMALPGLWDAHGHGIGRGLEYLAAGVTGMRVLAANADAPRPRWLPLEAGEWRQTRIVPVAVIDGPRSPDVKGGPSHLQARTAEDVRRLVDEHAAIGYRQIKIYNSLDPALVPVLIARTHDRGLRASGHIPSGVAPSEAIRAGLDEMHHGETLIRELVPSVRVGRRAARDAGEPHDLRALGGGVDLTSSDTKAYIALIRDRRVTLDPTLVAVEKSWTTGERSVAPVFTDVLPRLPLQAGRSLIGVASRGYPAIPEDRPDILDLHRRSFDVLLKLVGAMSDAGVPVLPGTDSDFPGFALHRELELHVLAGIPPARVLQAATLGTPRAMGLDDDVGSIEPGKLADLILVEGDPTRAIGDIRRIRQVIKDGALYDVAAIYRDLGIMVR